MFSNNKLSVNDIEFVSIGGWCGTKMALTANNYESASNPFDYVRSSMLGVIDCFENNFQNYFPESYVKQSNGFYLSQCCEFQHEDFADPNTIISLNRKISRFRDLLTEYKSVCFLRTITLDNFTNELKYYKQLQTAIEGSYQNLNYIICFIITKQKFTSYYKNLDDKTFVFSIDNQYTHVHDYLGPKYKYIFDLISNNNLFSTIPPANNIDLIVSNTELETLGLKHE